jgi:hypothetical protein
MEVEQIAYYPARGVDSILATLNELKGLKEVCDSKGL